MHGYYSECCILLRQLVLPTKIITAISRINPSIIVFPHRLSGSIVSVYCCCFQQLQGTVLHFKFLTNTSLYLESDEITLAHITLTGWRWWYTQRHGDAATIHLVGVDSITLTWFLFFWKIHQTHPLLMDPLLALF